LLNLVIFEKVFFVIKTVFKFKKVSWEQKMPSENFTDSVIYIEDSDIKGDHIENMPGKAIVMIQSAGCGHCTAAKPEFQKLANRLVNSDIQAYTVQADTDPKAARAIAKMVPGFRGFPTFITMMNGNYVATYPGGARTADDIENFLKQPQGKAKKAGLPPHAARIR
jgi:thiol-disulfide isomerase/thioredoxin